MGKQKSPGGVPSGLFCFRKLIQTQNDLIFISGWVDNINAGNEFLFFNLILFCKFIFIFLMNTSNPFLNIEFILEIQFSVPSEIRTQALSINNSCTG